MSRRWLLGLVTCLALLAIPMGVMLFLQDAPRALPPQPEIAPPTPADDSLTEPSPDGARIVFGTVTDADEEPVVDATLHIEGHPRISTISDEDGAFRLTATPLEALVLSITAPGFERRVASIPAGDAGDRHEMAITLERATDVRDPEAEEEAASIAGSVIDEGGRPVTEFVVSVESYKPPSDATSVAQRRKSESVRDDRGSFELAGLNAGSYVLVVSAKDYTPASSDSIVIDSGESVRGIRIKLQRGAVLVGRVHDPDGAPIQNAVVRLDGVSTTRVTGLEPARSDADGRYELRDTPRGPFSIRVTAEGFDSRVIAGIDARGSERLEHDIALTLSEGDKKTEYVGIGAMLIERSEGISVMQLIEGGPAEAAGVHAGDLILRIDGKDATDFTIPRAVQLLRGPPGTSVSITVRRDQTELRFTIVREAFSN